MWKDHTRDSYSTAAEWSMERSDNEHHVAPSRSLDARSSATTEWVLQYSQYVPLTTLCATFRYLIPIFVFFLHVLASLIVSDDSQNPQVQKQFLSLTFHGLLRRCVDPYWQYIIRLPICSITRIRDSVLSPSEWRGKAGPPNRSRDVLRGEGQWYHLLAYHWFSTSVPHDVSLIIARD